MKTGVSLCVAVAVTVVGVVAVTVVVGCSIRFRFRFIHAHNKNKLTAQRESLTVVAVVADVDFTVSHSTCLRERWSVRTEHVRDCVVQKQTDVIFNTPIDGSRWTYRRINGRASKTVSTVFKHKKTIDQTNKPRGCSSQRDRQRCAHKTRKSEEPNSDTKEQIYLNVRVEDLKRDDRAAAAGRLRHQTSVLARMDRLNMWTSESKYRRRLRVGALTSIGIA